MLMMSVKMGLLVDQIIVQLHLVLKLKLIVVINQLLEMNIFVHLEFLVEKMMEIVTLIVNVKAAFFVDIKTVQFHLVLTQMLIVVVTVPLQAMEKLDSAIVTLVEKIKEIVIQTLNVKATTFVDQTTALLPLVLALKLIAVVVLKL